MEQVEHEEVADRVWLSRRATGYKTRRLIRAKPTPEDIMLDGEFDEYVRLEASPKTEIKVAREFWAYVLGIKEFSNQPIEKIAEAALKEHSIYD